MNQKFLQIIVLCSLLFQSCSFEDSEKSYEERLVVFGSISANLPVIDTVLVSKTAEINEDINASQLWIDNADVKLIDDSTGSILRFYNLGSGRYFPITDTSGIQTYDKYLNFVIRPGSTYKLVVISEMGDSVIATTTVPTEMNMRSADLGQYVCPDGTVLPVDSIDIKNLENLSFAELMQLYANPINYVSENNINVDSVVYRFGECYTKSFASYPMFGVDFDSENYETIKILTYALEANKIGLEPLDTLSSILDPDSGGFFDYNFNGIRDSVLVNLIYDTTLGFRIWKGQYPRLTNNIPYRINPWQWNIEEAPTPIMWLYFDYYGLQLMTFKATSESYFNYFSGDPVGQNIYLLPDSNFEDGLGVFYSSNEYRFLLNVVRE